MTPRIEFSLLGPIKASADGEPVNLGGPKQRAVLAMLLIDANRVVSVDRLIEGVWGEDSHSGANATLQVYISNLRKALGGERIVTERPGYRIVVAADELDTLGFEEAIRTGNECASSGDHHAAGEAFERALSLWQGEALADLQYEPFAQTVINGLNEKRETAREAAWDALLALGRHRELVAELESATAATPLRERRWAQLMTALYRSGRQADALAAFATARRTLVEELGIDPGMELRDLEERILNQDPTLAWQDQTQGSVGELTTVRRSGDGSRPLLTLPNGTRIELEERTWSIGRSPDCDVILNSPDVSRRHAEIRYGDDGTWTAFDLDSTNGLQVNGATVAEVGLNDGDELVIGRYTLGFHLPSGD